MWPVVETKLDYQPEDSGAGADIEWYGGLQEKKLTFEEWNDTNKPTLPTVLKIPRELQEGKRLLKLQKCKNGGSATVAFHGPQLANGGDQANVSFKSHHRCLV